MNAASACPGRLADVPIVFMSYDEPWADETFDDLRKLRPDALRVHGVKGLDACHKAAAEVADADWFLTVDADTTLDPATFDVKLPERLMHPVFRLDWLSRNAVNGLVSGNGCLKLWPRTLAMAMRSHEAAPKARVSLDADLGTIRPGITRQVVMPGCYVSSDPARTPFHAFRAGFREAVFLTNLKDTETIADQIDSTSASPLDAILSVWCTIGAHTPNGTWMMYGARMGLWSHLAWPSWDPREVNDYDRMLRFWTHTILPRIGAGGNRCRYSGIRWDAARLNDEINCLADRLEKHTDSYLPYFNADVSRLIVESGLLAAANQAPALDAIGRVFQKGRGVPIDITAAQELYETAAVIGRPSAFANLARLHDLGLIEKADCATAEHLYKVAIKLGSPHAPSHLAEMLEADPDRSLTERRKINCLRDLAAERGFAGPGKGKEPRL